MTASFQPFVDHCVAAVFYDNGLTVIFLNIRAFDQNIGTQLRVGNYRLIRSLYPGFSSF